MKKNYISGVEIIKKDVISDERGKILHMLKASDKNFKNLVKFIFHMFFLKRSKLGIYIKNDFKLCCCLWKNKLVLYDDRKDSKTFGQIQEIFLSNDNHVLVSIPPLIWNGFTSADDNLAVLANCSDIPHDKMEISRLKYDDPKFPYDWNISK